MNQVPQGTIGNSLLKIIVVGFISSYHLLLTFQASSDISDDISWPDEDQLETLRMQLTTLSLDNLGEEDQTVQDDLDYLRNLATGTSFHDDSSSNGKNSSDEDVFGSKTLEAALQGVFF